MKWVDQAQPERVEPMAALAGRCGLPTLLELLLCAQSHALSVWVSPAAQDSIHGYLSGHRVEAGGLLLGSRLAPAAPGTVVSVERFVPGTDFDGTSVSLTLGTRVWDDARPHLDAGLVVVGWAHSHPDLGAFFSSTDRRTQRAFFSRPWQVGLCVDPVRGECAWFRGPDSRADDLRVLAPEAGFRGAH